MAATRFKAGPDLRSTGRAYGTLVSENVNTLGYRVTPAPAGCAFAPFGASARKRELGVINS